MVCGDCVDKLARKLMANHKIDMIRAYELAEKGVERVENRGQIQIKPKQPTLDDPYDYTNSCTASGICYCRVTDYSCSVSTDCFYAPSATCACACPSPPKAHSHLESNTCAVTHTTCPCTSYKCVQVNCVCGCSGLCYYHCDDGYVWNPATSECESAGVHYSKTIAEKIGFVDSHSKVQHHKKTVSEKMGFVDEHDKDKCKKCKPSSVILTF